MKPRRPGMTLIELLVTLSVISLLLALLAPAVQKARSAARALQCKANLRQLAQAVHAYHEVFNMVPGWQQPSPSVPLSSHPSIHAQILPHLDEADVYDAINFAQVIPQPYALFGQDWSAQTTAANARIGVFICPADGAAERLWRAPNSYRGNWGTGPYWAQTAEFPDSANGIFSSVSGASPYVMRFAYVFDGLSRTAMFAERLVGSGGSPFDPRRDVRSIPRQVRTAAETRRACFVSDRLQLGSYFNSGKYWLFSGIHQTLYTHILPPNSSIPDCQDFAALPPWGAASPRSNHGGWVNVAFGDASVRSVSESIDSGVWRALGTRNGGEVILDGSF